MTQNSRKERVAGGEATEVGSWGEGVAARFLQGRGFEVVHRNWRNPWDRRDELDLVCRDGELVVFVEVKTRREGTLVRGLFALDRRKQAALRRAIHSYLRCLSPSQRPRHYRCDVVEIEYGPGRSLGPEAIVHVENYPLLRTRPG